MRLAPLCILLLSVIACKTSIPTVQQVTVATRQVRQTSQPIDAYTLSVSGDDGKISAVATALADEGEIAIHVLAGPQRTLRVVAYAQRGLSPARSFSFSETSDNTQNTLFIGQPKTGSDADGSGLAVPPSVDVIVPKAPARSEPPSTGAPATKTAAVPQSNDAVEEKKIRGTSIDLATAVATYYGENTVDIDDEAESQVVVKVFPAGTLVLSFDSLGVSVPEAAVLEVENVGGARWKIPLVQSMQRVALPVGAFVIRVERFEQKTGATVLTSPTFRITHGAETTVALVFASAAACAGNDTSNTAGTACGVCGDGVIVPPETCDDGNQQSGDGCGSTCALEGAPPDCGDGKMSYPEQCDDGNRQRGDGCSEQCADESAVLRCGNDALEFPEQCDDGNNTPGDGCSINCKSEQLGAYCGNGIVDAGEECDPGTGAQTAVCRLDCQMRTQQDGACGDGTINPSEQCDLGAQNGVGPCTLSCFLPEGAPICGDGIVEFNEECDDGNTFHMGRCEGCRWTMVAPGADCGNGIPEIGEICDDGNTLDGDLCGSDCLSFGGSMGPSGGGNQTIPGRPGGPI